MQISHLALLPCLEQLSLSPNPLSAQSDLSTYRVAVLACLAAGTLSMGALCACACLRVRVCVCVLGLYVYMCVCVSAFLWFLFFSVV